MFAQGHRTSTLGWLAPTPTEARAAQALPACGPAATGARWVARPRPARPQPVAPDGYCDTDHDDQEGLPVEIPTVPPPPAGED